MISSSLFVKKEASPAVPVGRYHRDISASVYDSNILKKERNNYIQHHDLCPNCNTRKGIIYTTCVICKADICSYCYGYLYMCKSCRDNEIYDD